VAVSDWYADTDPKALEVFLRAQREMSAGQKVAAVLNLTGMLLRMCESDVRRLYPEGDEREVFLRAAARFLDRETMHRAYGWDPQG